MRAHLVLIADSACLVPKHSCSQASGGGACLHALHTGMTAAALLEDAADQLH